MIQRDKPRLALNNFTAGVRERSEWSGGPSDTEGKTTRIGASECGQRTSFNRTRAAGHLDEIQGVVANTLNSFRNGAVGFIDWLDLREPLHKLNDELADSCKQQKITELWTGFSQLFLRFRLRQLPGFNSASNDARPN